MRDSECARPRLIARGNRGYRDFRKLLCRPD